MIERYTLPEIGAVWTEEAKYRAWLRVELAVSRARAQLGEIPTAEGRFAKPRLVGPGE